MSTRTTAATASAEPDLPPTPGYPRKRRQTRRRLLRAGTVVLVERGPAQVTAGQIAAAAGVAVGTFYNHFPSVDNFVDAVADDLSHGVEIGRDTLNDIEHDPGRRVAIGVLQLLEMADTDPTAASAFVTLAALRPDFRARIRAVVGEAISDGVEAQLFDVVVGPAAVNAVLGTALQSMRSRVLGETDRDEAQPVARLVLRLLGVPTADIDSVVKHAAATLAAS
jgi:AcrR family transcriptional regulator